MRVAIVMNAASGRGRARAAADLVGVALVARGCAVEPISIGMLDGQPDRLRDGFAAVVAAGGDGTVRSVAARLAGSGVPIGIVPMGTENLAARALGFRRPVPELAPALAESIVAGRVRHVDLGWVQPDGAPRTGFVVMASAGFDADVVAALAARRRGAITHGSYALPIARTAWRWRAPRIRCSEDPAGLLAGQGSLVAANASAYALGLDPARGANPTDGQLDLVRVPGVGVAGVAAAVWRLWWSRGANPGARSLRSLRLPHAAVTFDRAVLWQVDGDALGAPASACAELGVDPGALAVLALP
jgi:diacylglycerol kinase family enzyme